jgi:hypothetical protein
MPQWIKIPNLAWPNSFLDSTFSAEGTYPFCPIAGSTAISIAAIKNTILI